MRPLLILDVDETLLHGADRELGRPCDLTVDELHVYFRPHVREFLLAVSEVYDLACWSSATNEYLKTVLTEIMPPNVSLVFLWDRRRCNLRTDFEMQRHYFLKDLRKVKRRGFDLNRVLILEDEPIKVSRNYGNAIYVKPYFGNSEDEELRDLQQYLLSIAGITNFRAIDKQRWRYRAKHCDK